MNIGMAVKYRILQYCKLRGITINKLATISGIARSTVKNITGGRNNSATISTIKKLCDGLEISLVDFFDAKVFDDLEQEIR